MKSFSFSSHRNGPPVDPRGFMQVPVDDDLPEVACDFVQARGARFNEGRDVTGAKAGRCGMMFLLGGSSHLVSKL